MGTLNEKLNEATRILGESEKVHAFGAFGIIGPF